MGKILGKWSIVWITLVWVAWDVIATNDHDRATWPLTHLIVAYLSPWVYFPGVLALAGWLVYHFWPGAHAGRVDELPEGNKIMSDSTRLPRVPSKTTARIDAGKRALRTFVQGLWVTVVGAVSTGLTVALSDGIRWTPEYWRGVELAVAGSIAMAVTSYVHRVVSDWKV